MFCSSQVSSNTASAIEAVEGWAAPTGRVPDSPRPMNVSGRGLHLDGLKGIANYLSEGDSYGARRALSLQTQLI
jgi:hypothetical protein